jgi:hypothetical protein
MLLQINFDWLNHKEYLIFTMIKNNQKVKNDCQINVVREVVLDFKFYNLIKCCMLLK